VCTDLQVTRRFTVRLIVGLAPLKVCTWPSATRVTVHSNVRGASVALLRRRRPLPLLLLLLLLLLGGAPTPRSASAVGLNGSTTSLPASQGYAVGLADAPYSLEACTWAEGTRVSTQRDIPRDHKKEHTHTHLMD
jgi:hypothetical protein